MSQVQHPQIGRKQGAPLPDHYGGNPNRQRLGVVDHTFGKEARPSGQGKEAVVTSEMALENLESMAEGREIGWRMVHQFVAETAGLPLKSSAPGGPL